MNSTNPNVVAYPKLRFALVLMAVLAAACVLAAAAAGASAGSGGVPTAGGGAADEPTADASKYDSLWAHVSHRDKRWARSTSQCESGGDPTAIGGGGEYRGAFQFMKSTWQAAPKSPGGDPIDYSYKTQAVVAIALMHRDGAGHWPVCG